MQCIIIVSSSSSLLKRWLCYPKYVSNAFSRQLFFTISDYLPVSARPAVPVLQPDSA